MKICFLASGGGGNFKFFHLAKKLQIINNFDLFIIADRKCDSTRYAKEHNIYYKIIHYKQKENQHLLNELDSIDPDIIITNWHKIIDKEVVSKYYGKLINLHYSLLPAFSGLIGMAPIKEAYKQNCKFIGVTCHFIDEGVDSGSIISQAIVKTDVPIENAITEVFKKGCLILYNSILIVLNKNSIAEAKQIKLDISPPLYFDDEIFDRVFWKRLSQL